MADKPELSKYLKRTQDRFARPFKLVDRVPNQNPDSAHRRRTHEDKVAKSHILEREDLYQPLQDVPDISTPPLDSPLNFYDNEPRNCAVRDRHFPDAGLVLSGLGSEDSNSNRRPVYTLPSKPKVKVQHVPFPEDVSPHPLAAKSRSSFIIDPNGGSIFAKHRYQHNISIQMTVCVPACVRFARSESCRPVSRSTENQSLPNKLSGISPGAHGNTHGATDANESECSNPATDHDAMGIRQGLLPDVEDDDMNRFGETDGASMDASATCDDSNFAPMDESNSELLLEELKFFTGDHSTLAGRFSSEAWKNFLNNKDQPEGSQEMQQKLYTKDSPRYQRELDCSLTCGVKAVFPTPRRVHADSPIEDAAGDEVETIKSQAKPSFSPCLPPPATGCLIDENCRAAPASHSAVPPASQTRPQGSGYTHNNVFRGTQLKQQQPGVLSVKERGGGAQLSHTELPGSASHPAAGLPPAAGGATGTPPKMSGGKVMIESPNRDENPDRDQDHMHLKVQGQDGRFQGFKIKKTSVLNKLIEQYCILEGLEMKRIFFLFDGNRVCGTQTPAELNMQNDDTIKVHCEKDSDDSAKIDLPQINEEEHEGDASITRDEFLKLKTQVHELQHQLYAAKSMLQTAFTLQPAFETSFTSLVGTCPDSPIPRTPSPGGFNADVTNAPTPSVHQSISGKSPEKQLAILRAQNVRLTAEKVELVNSLHRLEQQSMALVVDQVRNIKQKMHASFAKSAELERQRAEKISHGLATVCREVEAAVRESMGVEHVEAAWQRHLDDTNCHTNRSTRSYRTHSAANGGVASVASVASVARLWAAPDIARAANDTNVLSYHESDESELLPTRTTKWDVDSGGFGRGRNTPPPRANRGRRHSQSTSPQKHTTSPTPGRGSLTSGTLDKCYSDRSLRQENRGGGMSHSEGGTSGRVSALEAPLRLSFQERHKLAFSDYAAAQEEQAAKSSSFVDVAASGDASQLQIERLSWQTRAEATTEENKTIRGLEESIQRMAAELGREKKRATIAQALQVKLQQEMKVLRAHEQELLALVAQEQVVHLDPGGRVRHVLRHDITTTDAVYDESSQYASDTSLSYSINREFGERSKSKAVPLSPLISVDGYEHLNISPETADLLGPRLGLPLAYTRAQEYEASPRAPQYQYSRLNPESLSVHSTPEARALHYPHPATTRIRLAQEAQNQAMQKKQAVDPTGVEQNQSKATEKEKVMQNGNKNSEQDQGRRKPGERSTGLVEGRDGPASKVDTQQQDQNVKVGDASGASGKTKRTFSMSGVLKAFKLKNSATNSRPPS